MGSIKARTHKGTYSYEGDEDGGATTTRVKQLAYTKTSSGTNFEALTYTYTYDERGNITEIAGPISGTRHYEYDALGQMVEERIGDTVYSYGYDNAGNLTSYCGNALQYTDGDWKDLATSYRTWTHYHDEMGNPTSYHNGTRWNFQWNGRQLTQAKKSGTELPIDYVYDENGLRITKSVASADGTTVHTYLYDNSGALIRETRDYPDGTQDIMEFLYDQSGRPYAFVLNNVTYYYVLNLQGDIVRLVNTAGTTVVSYVYNAWGKILSTQTTSLSYSATVAAKNPLRYRGYYFDTESQLYYCQSRYYDPATGRFINADALTSTGQGILGNNMFAYCANSPVLLKDLSGFAAETALDVVSILLSLAELIGKPSWAAAGYLVWDVAAACVPFIPASYVAKSGKLAVKVASKIDDFAEGTQLLTGAYKQLKKLCKGIGGLEIHHLVEKRFAGLYSSRAKDFLSIPLTPEMHQIITNRWRNLHKAYKDFKTFAYGSDYRDITYDLMAHAIEEVYGDMPAILDEVLKWHSKNWGG